MGGLDRLWGSDEAVLPKLTTCIARVVLHSMSEPEASRQTKSSINHPALLHTAAKPYTILI